MRAKAGQKRSGTRTRGEDDENLTQLTLSPKPSLNKISSQKNKTVLHDLTNKRSVNNVLKDMGKRGGNSPAKDKPEQEMNKPVSSRQTRSKSKPVVASDETCENETETPPKIPSSASEELVENVAEETSAVNATKNRKPARKANKQVQKVAAVSPPQNVSEEDKCEETESSSQTSSDGVAAREASETLKVADPPKRGRQTRSTKATAKAVKPIEDVLPPKPNNSSLLPAVTESPRPVRQTRKLAQGSETPSKRAKITQETPKPADISDSENDAIVKKPTRQTRSQGAKSPQKVHTPNKPNKSTLKSPKPAESDESESDFETKKKPPRQTRSGATKSPVAEKKSPAPKKTRATKATKPNATLDKWIQPARKSNRLSNPSESAAKLLSPKRGIKSPAGSKLLSPGIFKSPSKLLSPRNGKSPLTKKSEQKRVPVWRTEPKPEGCKSLPDDIYDFEFDPINDCKPVKIKKKRTRKPKAKNDSAVFEAKHIKAPPKRAPQAPRAAVKAVLVEKEKPPSVKPKTPVAVESEKRSPLRPKAVANKSFNSVSPLLTEVAEKLQTLSESQNLTRNSECSGPYDDEFDHPSSLGDFSAIENVQTQVYEPSFSEGDKSVESGVLAGELEHTEHVKSTNVSQEVDPSIENCFGFEEQENSPLISPPKAIQQHVKSTPLKTVRNSVVATLPSVSPVRKIAKSTRKGNNNRPARIDQDVAREMIRGIRPLQPIKDKQTSLVQFIQDVSEPVNEPKTTVVVPSTPPSAFVQVKFDYVCIKNFFLFNFVSNSLLDGRTRSTSYVQSNGPYFNRMTT